MTRAQILASLGLLFLLGLSLQACTAGVAHGAEPIRLSVTIVRSNPVTTITVGDQTVRAIIDTGGTVEAALTLTKEVLDSAGAVDLGTPVVTSDAFGHEVTTPRFRVPAITVGGHAFQDLTALQTPMRADGPPVPNVIGRLFLSHYLVVVDYAGGSITLWPPNTKNSAGINCGGARIPMEHTKDDALAVGNFDTQSGRLRLLWDTGATYSMLPEMVAENLRLVTTVRGPNSPQFYLSKIISAAGQDFGPLEFVILPLKLPADFHGLIGSNFFERHVVCLDYKRREVRVR